MNNFRRMTTTVACGLAIAIGAIVTAGDPVFLRLDDGTRWRGETGQMVEVNFREGSAEQTVVGTLLKATDQYVKIEGKFLGEVQSRVIFLGDVISIGEPADDDSAAEVREARQNRDMQKKKMADDSAKSDGPGLFMLPLEGMVGMGIRHNEIKMIGEEADKYGPGQIIVLKITTNGGLVSEALKITEEIEKLKKKHRVVAWIKKAISAGCSTAMSCDEIYFMSEGVAGSVTTLAGGRSLSGPEAELHVESLVELARQSGYSEHIARAMKLNKYQVSYDKDPETGDVQFYGDLRGEYILSDGESNLSFNADNALHCGFSKGTADTEEDLALLLDLPKWELTSNEGQKLYEDWQRTWDQFDKELPELMRQIRIKGASQGAQAVIGNQINALKRLVRWWDRAELLCYLNGVPPKEELERIIEELRLQLAEIRRNQRGR